MRIHENLYREGGKSTGPKTEDARQRCADAKTLHGWETRAIREQRKQKLAELRELEVLLKKRGLI
mgnify:FL=1